MKTSAILISFLLPALYSFTYPKNTFENTKEIFTDTFQTPKGEQLNVKTFGAVGDNSTDDGPAIQKALDKAATMEGAIVVFPDGTYLISNPGNGDSGKGKNGLRVGSNTTLQLAANAVLHKKGNEEIIGNKDFVNGNKNIVITGGTFQTDSGTDQKWAPSRTGIKFVNVSNSQIKNCSFKHIGNSAISIEKNSVDNIVSDCRFTDVFNCAIEFYGQRNIARNNYLHDMGSDGILVNGDDCTVSKNRMINIGKYSAPSLGSPISLGVDNHSCKNNKILNNTMIGAAAYGIINDRGANTLIQGNTITNTGSAGIKIGGGGLNSIINKNIIKNTGLIKDRKGIYLQTGIIIDGANVTLNDNILSNVTGTGIYINNSATNTVIKRCTITSTKKPANGGVESAGIQVRASNVSIENTKSKRNAGDAVLIKGNVTNVKIKDCLLSSTLNSSSFKIDSTKEGKPSKVIISNCKTGNVKMAAKANVVNGDDITFENMPSSKVTIKNGSGVKKIMSNQVNKL